MVDFPMLRNNLFLLYPLLELNFLFKKFICVFLAALDLCCCKWPFSSCSEYRLLLLLVHRLLIVVASLVAEHLLYVLGLE